MTIPQILNKIVHDLLTDLSSLRVILIIAAFGFNVYLFQNHAAENIQLAGIGLLTAVYSFYFYSKHVQAKNEIANADGDPQTSRDPDQ